MISFKDAVKSGFMNAMDSSGRATRAEYWWWALFIWLVILPLIIIPGVLDSTFKVSPTTTEKFYFLLGLWFVVIIIPTISLSIRRLHDIGKSAWYLLVDVIPYIGNIIFTILMCLPSKPDNKYGPNPRAEEYQNNISESSSETVKE